MKVGLRDKFRTTDFLDVSQPLMERIGALYYSGQQADKPRIQERLEDLLRVQTGGTTGDHQEMLLRLHAAAMLAQHGNFAGIEFILDILSRGQNQGHFRLAETALRNCSQFPLAVLLAQLIDLGNVTLLDDRVIGLMKQSDDDLFELSNMEEQNSYFDGLVGQLLFLEDLPHLPGRKLSVGTMISRPIRKDFGFRYTGFVAVDNSHQEPLVVPFDMGDVLNRNDQRARQDVYQLMRYPGRRAIVVHDPNPPYEADQLYILPFATQSRHDIEILVSKLAIGALGLKVGIVAELSVGKREGYRIITADGQSQLGYYMANRKEIGSAFLIHEDNSKPLNTRFRVPKNTVSQVVQLFKKSSALDVGVYIRSYENKHWFASHDGHLAMMWGESAPAACFVEEVVIDDERRFFAFELPELDWSSEERVSILAHYWKKNPDSWGIVLEVFENRAKRFARIAHPYSKSSLVTKVNQDYSPGTLVFCEKGQKRVRVDPWKYVASKYAVNQLVQGTIRNITNFGAFVAIEPELEGLIHKSQLSTSEIADVHEIVSEGEVHLVRIVNIDLGRKRIGLSLKEVSASEQVEWMAGYTGEKTEQENNQMVDAYFAHVLSDYRIEGGCDHCFNSGIGLCIDCGGDSDVLCPDCDGKGHNDCEVCSGTGKTRCANCEGTGSCSKCTNGYWRSGQPCPICHATGVCRSCKPLGSGLWNCAECHARGSKRCSRCTRGRIKCPACKGERVSKCYCGGMRRGRISIVA